MSAPQRLDPRDIATLERAIRRYQSLGFEASLGVTNEAHGRAAIWYVNPRTRGSDTFQFEIEKYSGTFGTVAWVIQIARSNGSSMTMSSIDQVSSNILLFALTKAEILIAEGKELKHHSLGAKQDSPIKANRTELASLNKIAAAMRMPASTSSTTQRNSGFTMGPNGPAAA